MGTRSSLKWFNCTRRYDIRMRAMGVQQGYKSRVPGFYMLKKEQPGNLYILFMPPTRNEDPTQKSLMYRHSVPLRLETPRHFSRVSMGLLSRVLSMLRIAKGIPSTLKRDSKTPSGRCGAHRIIAETSKARISLTSLRRFRDIRALYINY